MRTILAAMLILAVAAPSIAQTSKTPAPAAKYDGTLTLLDQRIPEVSVEDLPLEQVIEWLQDYTGMNFHVRWQTLIDAGVARDKPITLRVKGLRLSQVLWMVMNEAGGPDIKLAYRASGKLLIFSTEEDLGKEMLVRVYEVADLLARVTKFRDGPQIDVQNAQQGGGGTAFGSGSGGSNNGGEDATGQQGQQPGQIDPDLVVLMNLIQTTIQPETWTVNSGTGTIAAWRTQIIVRNNIRVHQELGGPVSDGGN